MSSEAEPARKLRALHGPRQAEASNTAGIFITEKELVEIVHDGELKNIEADWQALFHPPS